MYLGDQWMAIILLQLRQMKCWEYHIDKDQQCSWGWSVSSLQVPFCGTDGCVMEVALLYNSLVMPSDCITVGMNGCLLCLAL